MGEGGTDSTCCRGARGRMQDIFLRPCIQRKEQISERSRSPKGAGLRAVQGTGRSHLACEIVSGVVGVALFALQVSLERVAGRDSAS